MKTFKAFPKKNEFVAIEALFDIIAESKTRANELIESLGENSEDFYLDETFGVKDQMGNFSKETIIKITKKEEPDITQELTAESVFEIAKSLNPEEYYSLISLILKRDEEGAKDIIFNLLKWKED
ncbi:hypothetical protein SAMN04489761_3437 [Tenacibaculum sp. MAR_2009_124]|uniref:hypothetical protein n=1 Tax=Tenacibaculum sp. MAR_2009_124 TaxID=1250059 RepID=UPI0008947856|nr:hypothetical protein [Tenacibaculum sp. MAR_2009_124]SEC66380.1 hypothetical protein SAMN04489761_3437 [Tenacibaculum sp. MAR_2009_124]